MRRLHLSFFLLAVLPVGLFAQDQLGPFPLDNKGTLMALDLSASEKTAKSATFYFVTKDPVTSAVETYVEGPPGLSATISIGALGSKSPAAAAQDYKRMYQVPLRSADGKSRPKMSIVAATANATSKFAVAKEDSGYASCLASDAIKQIVALCAQQGSPCTAEQLCSTSSNGGSSSSGGGSSSSGNSPLATGLGSDQTPDASEGPVGTMQTLFHFHKDMCSAKGRKAAPQYIAAVVVDLTGVDPSRFSTGFKIKIGAKEYDWDGSRAASVKDRGDGMYKEPLLLMSSVGYYGSEYFNLVKWVGGKPSRVTKLPVSKYASYRGLSLSVGRLSNVLTRDLVTVELSNGGWIYSAACFRMAPQRQIANGYPDVP